MNFKSVEGLDIYITREGKIGLEQYSLEYEKDVVVHLTLDQFRKLQRWVDKNELELDERWNGGVEDA